MPKKSESKPLKNDGMNILVKLFFSMIFLVMGTAILGAGLRGNPATAPIVMTIGMLMVVIALAPYIVKVLYPFLVPKDAPTSA